MNTFFDMGGYGSYVWPAWVLAIIVLAALTVVSLRTMRARERELSKLESDSPRRWRRDLDGGDK